MLDHEAQSREGVGVMLRERREELGLSIEHVARECKIHPRYLEALEEERYVIFSARVYARGFLKKVLEALGALDRDEILRQFEIGWSVYMARRTVARGGPFSHTSSIFFITPRHLVAVAGLFFVVLFFFLAGRHLVRFTGAPALTLEAPQKEEVFFQPSVRLRGATEPESRLTMNGREITIDEAGRFNEIIELGAGVTTLELVAQNRFGKTTTAVRNIVVR